MKFNVFEKHLGYVFLLVVWFPAFGKTNTGKFPNVLLIQADDLGYDDLSLHGNPHLETPSLDQLGKESVQFSQFYLQNVCAPSRAALLTGRNYLRTGVTSVHAGRDYMNLDETTIAEVFKANGYITGMWGKWHSGKTNGYFPWDRGFDEAYYACLYNYFDNKGLLNGREVNTPGFTTDAITDMAISFIKRNKDQPFFAYMSHLAPHNPWRAPRHYINKYSEKGLSLPLATLYGMIDNLDHNVGRLVNTVDSLGLGSNTIIVFLSDNGPAQNSYRFGLTRTEWEGRNPSAMKGSKGSNWENGIRSTLFVRWKNKLKPAIVDRLSKIEDLFPTLVAMSGISMRDTLHLDGIDFSQEFYGQPVPGGKIYFSHHSPKGHKSTIEATRDMSTPSDPLTAAFKASFVFEHQGLAVRDGDWKFIQNQDGAHRRLYNIKADPGEKNNLIHLAPGRAKSMQDDLSVWYQSILQADSYNMPVFQIGYKNRAFNQVYACSPRQITGSLENQNHYLSHWTTLKDVAQYAIKVHTPGAYEVFLIHEIDDFENYGFRLSSGHSFVESTLVDSRDRDFGTLIEGESAYWEDFDHQETFRKSIVKSSLGKIELTKNMTYLELSVTKIPARIHLEARSRVLAIHLEKQ